MPWKPSSLKSNSHRRPRVGRRELSGRSHFLPYWPRKIRPRIVEQIPSTAAGGANIAAAALPGGRGAARAVHGGADRLSLQSQLRARSRGASGSGAATEAGPQGLHCLRREAASAASAHAVVLSAVSPALATGRMCRPIERSTPCIVTKHRVEVLRITFHDRLAAAGKKAKVVLVAIATPAISFPSTCSPVNPRNYRTHRVVSPYLPRLLADRLCGPISPDCLRLPVLGLLLS
jgi:hypothetical protein